MSNELERIEALAPYYAIREERPATRAPSHHGPSSTKSFERGYAISLDAFVKRGEFNGYGSGPPLTYDPNGEDAELAHTLNMMAERISAPIAELRSASSQFCSNTDEIPSDALSPALQALRTSEPMHFNRLYEMSKLLDQPEWTMQDRRNWEYYLVQSVAFETDGRYGEYAKNGRSKGSLSKELADGGWECELQSIVDGLVIHQVEARTLHEDTGWKRPIPYYYISGKKIDSPAFEDYKRFGHAFLFSPTGGVIETTLKHDNLMYRHAYDGENNRLSQADLLDESRVGEPIFVYSRTSYAGNALAGDIYIVDHGNMRAKDTPMQFHMDSDYFQPFFPEQFSLLSQTTPSAKSVPSEMEYKRIPSSLRMLERTDLLNPEGAFLVAARAAQADGEIDTAERAALNDLLANADSIYRRSTKNNEGITEYNTNFRLSVEQTDTLPNIGIRFLPGVSNDKANEAFTEIALDTYLEEVDPSTPVKPAPTPGRSLDQENPIVCAAPK